MKKISKSYAQEQIKDFFINIKNKTPKEVKKIKKLAMGKSIPLKDLRKKFCKKCFFPYNNSEIKIKNKIKIIICRNCGEVSRWKID